MLYKIHFNIFEIKHVLRHMNSEALHIFHTLITLQILYFFYTKEILNTDCPEHWDGFNKTKFS